jgi:hypothetical protein
MHIVIVSEQNFLHKIVVVHVMTLFIDIDIEIGDCQVGGIRACTIIQG